MFSKEGLEIQSSGEHRERPVRVARPMVTWAVPIEFEPITVRVAKVNCFTDAVVGCAVEANTMPQQPAHGVGEIRPRRIKDGRMIQAGRTRRCRLATCAFPRVEPNVMMVSAGG